MQHPITNRSDNTSNRESICATGLHQNLNRAFVLFEVTPANEISLLDLYERTLGKCCTDPLRPPVLSECGPNRMFSTAIIFIHSLNGRFPLASRSRRPKMNSHR